MSDSPTVVDIGGTSFLLGRMLMRAFRATAADIKGVTSLRELLNESDPTAAADALLPMARVIGATIEDYRAQSGAHPGCAQMTQDEFVCYCDALDYRTAMQDLPHAFAICMSGATPQVEDSTSGESPASAPGTATEAKS